MRKFAFLSSTPPSLRSFGRGQRGPFLILLLNAAFLPPLPVPFLPRTTLAFRIGKWKSRLLLHTDQGVTRGTPQSGRTVTQINLTSHFILDL